MKALWAMVCVLGAMGCIADVETGEASWVDEDVGEAVDPVTLGQCRVACGEGGNYFKEQFCPRLDPIRGLACSVAVINAVDICEGRCRNGMAKRHCETLCCDRGADALERYCGADGVPDDLRSLCRRKALDAGGTCNRNCR